MGCLEKSMSVWPQTLQGVDTTWGESRRLPFLCFVPSYLFFFHPPHNVIVEKRGVDACEALGVTVPLRWSKWAGFTGVWRGGGPRKVREKDRCKRIEQLQAAELPWLQRNGWMSDITVAGRWGSVKLIWWRSSGRRLSLGFRQADTFLSLLYAFVSCERLSLVRLCLFTIPPF